MITIFNTLLCIINNEGMVQHILINIPADSFSDFVMSDYVYIFYATCLVIIIVLTIYCTKFYYDIKQINRKLVQKAIEWANFKKGTGLDAKEQALTEEHSGKKKK